MIRDLLPTRGSPSVVGGLYSYHQTDTYSCGAAVAATIIRAAWRRDPGDGSVREPSLRQIRKAVAPDPHYGAYAPQVIGAIESLGGVPVTDVSVSWRSVRQAVAKQHPILAVVQMPWQTGNDYHWVVVAGYKVEDGIKKVLVLNHTRRPFHARCWWTWKNFKDSLCPDKEFYRCHLS